MKRQKMSNLSDIYSLFVPYLLCLTLLLPSILGIKISKMRESSSLHSHPHPTYLHTYNYILPSLTFLPSCLLAP